MLNKDICQERYLTLINKLADLRIQLPNIHTGLSENDFILINNTLKGFLTLKTVQIFLEDCRSSVNGVLDFSKTRDFVFTKEEPIVMGIFKAPYNKSLALDGFWYEDVEPDHILKSKYPNSKATPISVLSSTFGFAQYPTCVALFPENFVSKKEFKDEFTVFYFINVFLRRFEEFGKPILERFVSEKSFWRIKRLNEKTLRLSFATWLHLHEYFHSQGTLPYNDYFKIKNSKNTAALEELRVDVKAILACLNLAKSGYDNAYFYAEVILFERLLRYSAHSDPENNYDARSSLIFLNFLQENLAITLENNQTLDLNKSKISDILSSYIQLIDNLENGIKTKLQNNENDSIDYKNLREPLIEFAKRYSGNEELVKSPFLNSIYNHSTKENILV